MKVHRVPGEGDVVAVCDRELLNQVLRHGDVEVPISDRFYGDRPATDDEVRGALRGASSINLFGQRTVELATEMGLVEEAACLLIGGVPHAQVYFI